MTSPMAFVSWHGLTRKDPRPLLDAIERRPDRRTPPCLGPGWLGWSDKRQDRQLAAETCRASCPVLNACRAQAVANRERHGVWGGVDVESEYRERTNGN